MKMACYLGGVVAVVLSYAALFFLGPAATDLWVREDGVIEWLGAIALLAASVFFLLTLIRGRRAGRFGGLKQMVVAGLALLFFVGAGEEISWGQRIFGVATPPALQSINKQGELNLHNLLAPDSLFNANNLFRIFWIVFGVVVPVVAVMSKRAYAALDRVIPVLPLWVAAFLVGSQIVAKVADVVNAHHPSWYLGSYYFFRGARVEVTESVVSVILGFGAYALYRQTTLLDAAKAPQDGVLAGPIQ